MMKWVKGGNIFNPHWSQLPIVDSDNPDFWRVFYSNRINNKSYPMYFDVEPGNPSKVLRRSESPLLHPGTLGSFDYAGVMPAEIINYKDTKYLFYIGWTNRLDVPYHNTIGLATSIAGQEYQKYSLGPVFGTSHKEPGFTGTISIMVENDIWRGWYLSCREWRKIGNKIESFYDIKYAESKNGIDWDPKNVTCISRQGNIAAISQSSVIKEGDTYYMWFSHRGHTNYRIKSDSSYKIGMATSMDGISWDIEDLDALPRSEEGWDSDMTAYPYVVAHEGRKFMFYNGNNFGKTGVGYATK
jgi:hypothetical protein